jgi:hypothetical protein
MILLLKLIPNLKKSDWLILDTVSWCLQPGSGLGFPVN